MNRRGTALVMVLWLIVLLAGVAAVGMGGTRSGVGAARNRIALLRAAWAREACLAILLTRADRVPDDSLTPDRVGLEPIDLGQEVWCAARASDPSERVQVNLAAPAMLQSLCGDSAYAIIAQGRPWPAVEALPEQLAMCRPLLSARGPGRINLNRAARAVLQALPGMDAAGAAAIVARRPFRTLDEALAALPEPARAQVLARYDAFQAAAALRAEVLVVEVVGASGRPPLSATMTVTLVPAGGRLAVTRREAT